MSDGLAASDVVRSMMRMGFHHDEIYDVLTGIGLPGEQVQLLIDRVSADFNLAGIESRPSRLGVEVGKIFTEEFEELRHSILTQLDSLARKLEFLKAETEKLGRRVLELQSILLRARRFKKRKSPAQLG